MLWNMILMLLEKVVALESCKVIYQSLVCVSHLRVITSFPLVTSIMWYLISNTQMVSAGKWIMRAMIIWSVNVKYQNSSFLTFLILMSFVTLRATMVLVSILVDDIAFLVQNLTLVTLSLVQCTHMPLYDPWMCRHPQEWEPIYICS